MNLHIPTMFVMILIATLIAATALGVISYRRLPELRNWAVSLSLQVLAYALLSLRGQISDLWSIVGANACITASVALYAAGLYRFHHHRYPWAVLAVPLVACVAGFWFWMDDYRSRLVFASVLWLFQSLHMLALVVIFRERTVGRGQYILGTAVAIFAAMQVYRLWAVLAGADTSTHFTDVTPMVVTTYFSSLTSTLLLAIGVLTMIQERYESALGDSEVRYRKLIDSATQGICVFQDGLFRFLNPKILELLGYGPSDLVNHAFLPFLHPDDQAKVPADPAQRLDSEGEKRTYTVRMQTRNRGWRWMEISSVPFDWHGRPATLNFLTDITERRLADDRIRDLAYHDSLTHLPNRRLLLEHLKLARAASGRSRKHGALVFIDLDNFKPLNDQHGHAVGDLLLIEVAQRLLQNIRGADTASRFGGDEFVVLLTQLSEDAGAAREHAQQFAEKLLKVLEQPYRLPVEHDGATHTVEHRCTGTAGVVLWDSAGDSDDALIDRADAAMYEAKQAGRNCVRFSDAAA